MKPVRIKKLDLQTTQGSCGTLNRGSQFVVRYTDEALGRPDLAISLTMPPRPEGWSSNEIPPILAMNLPEGFLLHRVIERYRKAMDIDDMNLLAVTSTPAAGRLWASTPGDATSEIAQPMALREILAYRGAEDLFDELLDRYATASISGVQPKVVVPEKAIDDAAGFHKRASIKAPDLIVKSASAEFPDLAENEYLCMSIARRIGLETPEFWLSDDRKLFVVRRFDVGPNGFLGFEDLATLTGKHPRRKYEGSYGDVARAIGDFAAPANRIASLDAFFRSLVLNCVIRNGDAHLKNFGVLYGDPSTAAKDARLSPVYDMICSTVYLPKDILALSLGGSKAWPDGKRLERFGREHCEIRNATAIIDDVIAGTLDYDPENKSGIWKKIRAEIEVGVQAVRSSAPRRRRATVAETKRSTDTSEGNRDSGKPGR